MERTITATEFKNHAGQYIDAAGKGPVVITKHDRPARVLLDIEEYRRLKRLDDRQVLRAEEISDEDLAEIAKGRMPADQDNYARLSDARA